MKYTRALRPIIRNAKYTHRIGSAQKTVSAPPKPAVRNKDDIRRDIEQEYDKDQAEVRSEVHPRVTINAPISAPTANVTASVAANQSAVPAFSIPIGGRKTSQAFEPRMKIRQP